MIVTSLSQQSLAKQGYLASQRQEHPHTPTILEKMAEDARSENRLLSKHKWRGKLFSTEWRSAESLESTDNDVANFLQGANAKPEAKSRPIAIAPRPSIAADARRFPFNPHH